MGRRSLSAGFCTALALLLARLSYSPHPTAAQPPQSPSGVSAVAVSGDRIAAIVDNQLVALRLNADERSLVKIGRAGLAPPVGSGYGLALHPDGTFAAVVDSTGVALVAFDAGGSPVVTRLEGDLLRVGARAVAFAGQRLLTLAIPLENYSFNDPIDVTMRIYDVTDMRAPQRIGALTWQRPVGAGASLTGFAASERAAYIGIANNWRGSIGGHVEIVDLSEPSNPRPLPVFAVGGLPRGLAVDGDSLWVATATGSNGDRGAEGADGLQRYDTADLTKPIARGWLALDVPPIDVAASHGGVWLTLGGTPPPDGQLAVVDAADPSRPRLVRNRKRDFAAEPRALAASGQRLAYGDAAGRVDLFHLDAGRDGPGAGSIAWWPDDGRPGPFATRGFPTETPTAVVTPHPTLDPATIVGRLWLPAVMRVGWGGPWRRRFQPAVAATPLVWLSSAVNDVSLPGPVQHSVGRGASCRGGGTHMSPYTPDPSDVIARSSRGRRAWRAVAAAALAAGLAGGWIAARNVEAHAPLQRYYPPYPGNPYPGNPYPYPCYNCPPGFIYYPSGCATPFAPPPPEMTTLPIPPGVTMPPPIGTVPATATAPLPPAPPPGSVIPTPTPGGAAQAIEYKICPQKQFDIPKVIQDQAMAEPWTIYGYGMKRNPNVPYHPLYNSYRHWLSTQNMNMPYSICNPAIWKAGCP